MKGFFEIADTQGKTILVCANAVVYVREDRDTTTILLAGERALVTRESFTTVKTLIRDAVNA